MTPLWSWERAFEAIPLLLEGFQITLLATVLGMVIAAILGLVIAILRRSRYRWISMPVGWINEFIRQTPLLVQLVFAYYLFTSVEALHIGIAVLGLHYATYLSEVYRAGIEGVAPGQWEATRALSMSPVRTWQAVILPQAIRSTLPSLGNYAVSMFKETPYLFAISVVELVTAAQQFGARNFQYLEAITLAGFIFLLASYPTSLLVRKLEKRLAY
jgi:polar amino acid transport system permease protein